MTYHCWLSVLQHIKRSSFIFIFRGSRFSFERVIQLEMRWSFLWYPDAVRLIFLSLKIIILNSLWNRLKPVTDICWCTWCSIAVSSLSFTSLSKGDWNSLHRPVCHIQPGGQGTFLLSLIKVNCWKYFFHEPLDTHPLWKWNKYVSLSNLTPWTNNKKQN